ncbi:MAG: GspH/FimT family pseudopilin [Proteobacteria bacterium]|nr:GspH/FimT family pseudopilin [Pseudomonadota bacterium]MBS0461463.1 GspH/FimT family pseudopilin [Pseudomonadota bacterium]
MYAIRSDLSHPVPHACRGLSLIELLIVLAIAMLLFGVALPAVSGAVAATHAMQARSALMASYQLALTGAAVANSRTTLCPSADGESCQPGSDWSQGWIAFVDANADRQRQAGEAILSRQPALSHGVHLRSTRGRTHIEIQASGSVGGSNVTFTLCDARGAAHAQALVLSNKSILRLDAANAEAIAETCAP